MTSIPEDVKSEATISSMEVDKIIVQTMADVRGIRDEGVASLERAGRVVAKLMDGYIAIARLVDNPAIRNPLTNTEETSPPTQDQKKP